MAKKNENAKVNAEVKTSKKAMTREEFVEKTLKAQNEAKAKKSATKAKTEAKATTAKKQASKKTAEKKPIEKSVKPAVKKATGAKPKAKTKVEAAPAKFDLEARFPSAIEVDGAEYARMSITEWSEVVKLYEGGADLFIAIEFDKDEISDYEELYDVPAPKKGFKDDLDFLQVILIQSNNVHRIVAASVYTEALVSFFKKEIKFSKSEGLKVGGVHFCFYSEAK